MYQVSFTVPMAPTSKGRPRFANGRAYTPKETHDAEAIVRQHCQRAMAGEDPWTGPVSIRFVYYTATMRRNDVDNITKLTMDGMIGTLYVDDSQVDDEHSTIIRAMGEEPRIEVKAKRLPYGATRKAPKGTDPEVWLPKGALLPGWS